MVVDNYEARKSINTEKASLITGSVDIWWRHNMESG